MSRLENAKKNAFWSLVHIVVTAGFGFTTRYVFMKTLGEEYLGLNGLFLSVLNVLSFAELGLGTAMAFCFYKPVAEEDIPQICALLQFCKKCFRVIMAVIAALGLAMMPFLHLFIKDYQGIRHFYLYYLIALVNTIATYLLVYKTCYQSACQEAYRATRIATLFWVITAVAQLFIMIRLRDYLLYLVVSCALNLCEKLVTSILLDRWYPLIRRRATEPVDPATIEALKKNVRALFIINVGQKVVTQADTLITSRFVGLGAVGLLSNYILIRDAVLNYISFIPGSITGSMGNLVAREGDEVQLNVFGIYQTICGALAVFSFCGLAVFLNPFLSLLFGPEKTLSEATVFLLSFAALLCLQQSNLDILRSTHGAYEIGYTLAFWQSAVNLAVSIPAAIVWGTAGVYLGTAAAYLVPYLAKPRLIFRALYHCSARPVYQEMLWETFTALVLYGVLRGVRYGVFLVLSGWEALLGTILASAVVFPPLLWLFLRRCRYYPQTVELVRRALETRIPGLKRR